MTNKYSSYGPDNSDILAEVGVKATAAAPTLVEGSSANEMSCDLAGNLRTKEASGAAILAKLIAAPATEAKQDALTTLIGSLSDAAWDNSAPSPSLVALLKKIAINTTPAG